MIVILTSVTFLTLSLVFGFSEWLTQTSVVFHHLCLRSLPSIVENRASLEALVCGKNLENLELKHLLMQTSLIHLFIVSGSHFLLLHKILAVVLRSRWWPFLPLGVYALVTLCQPPGVRSLIFLFLAELSEREKLFCSPVVQIFLSAVFSVSIFPEWLHSRSLLMSLFAALVITFAGAFWKHAENKLAVMFATQCSVFLFMSVCLWGLSNLHPLGILLNILLGPLIGVVLFPLGVLCVVLPFLTSVFDAAMWALVKVLERTEEVLEWQSLATPVSVQIQWILFLTLLMTAYSKLVDENRRRIHEF